MGKLIKNKNINNGIEGVLVTPLKVISVYGGDVMHGLKATDRSYNGFGEAYFSMIESAAIKAWKKHTKMTLNLIVPNGSVRFVIYDERTESETNGKFQEFIISRENFIRLTIPPYLWFGFQGIGKKTSLLLNIADIEHQPDEIERRELNDLNFNWRI